MRPSPLTGPEMGELQRLLAATFGRERFGQLLRHRLDKDIEHFVAPSDDFLAALYRVIDHANRERWWPGLVAAARAARPSDPALQAFGERFALAPSVALDDRRLEAQIRKARSTYDIASWRARLGEIEGQVCHVGLPSSGGTGFLVGPEVVMTNYHVVEPLLDGRVHPAEVTLWFDYAYTPDGTTLRRGTPHRLAEDWCLAASPYRVPLTPDAEPGDGQLDFALLRVEGRPGEEPVGGPSPDPAPRRGWVAMPGTDHDFAANPALHIVQHPGGGPLVVAFDTEAVIGVNDAGTRVRYRTTTSPGSSGAPCFGPDWQWVALHHAAGGASPAAFNEGIPVAALRRATARWNTGTALSG